MHINAFLLFDVAAICITATKIQSERFTAQCFNVKPQNAVKAPHLVRESRMFCSSKHQRESDYNAKKEKD
jgi:hypothetical protein